MALQSITPRQSHTQTPRKFIIDYFTRRFKTFIVDEHMTSQCCPTCHGRMVDDKKIGKGDRVLRYKRCRTCDVVWDRDVVAAVNIAYVFVHMLAFGERPQSFRSHSDVFGGGAPNAVDDTAMRLKRVGELMRRLRAVLRRLGKLMTAAAAAAAAAPEAAAAASCAAASAAQLTTGPNFPSNSDAVPAPPRA